MGITNTSGLCRRERAPTPELTFGSFIKVVLLYPGPLMCEIEPRTHTKPRSIVAGRAWPNAELNGRAQGSLVGSRDGYFPHQPRPFRTHPDSVHSSKKETLAGRKPKNMLERSCGVTRPPGHPPVQWKKTKAIAKNSHGQAYYACARRVIIGRARF